jgi:hypothetical protein
MHKKKKGCQKKEWGSQKKEKIKYKEKRLRRRKKKKNKMSGVVKKEKGNCVLLSLKFENESELCMISSYFTRCIKCESESEFSQWTTRIFTKV